MNDGGYQKLPDFDVHDPLRYAPHTTFFRRDLPYQDTFLQGCPARGLRDERPVLLYVSLDPFKLPAVAVAKRYSTAGREIGVPYKGRIIQQGWVMPTEAEAAALMKKISQKISECRYSGSAVSVLEPGTRLSGVSVPHTYPRDEYGWQGHRVEQTLSTNNRRASVNTRLLIQRGHVVLAVEYINYTRRTDERLLREYNSAALRKILHRSA